MFYIIIIHFLAKILKMGYNILKKLFFIIYRFRIKKKEYKLHNLVFKDVLFQIHYNKTKPIRALVIYD